MVGGERNEDAMAGTIDGKMKEFLDVVEATATRLPSTVFALVEPMRRPGLPWYEEKVANIIDFPVHQQHEIEECRTNRGTHGRNPGL